MSLQELREQALQLSVSDRLALMSTIIESLQHEPTSTKRHSGSDDWTSENRCATTN